MIFLTLLSVAKSIVLNCDFKYYKDLDNPDIMIYACETMDLSSTLQGEGVHYVTNLHEQGQRDRDVKIFSVRRQICFYIPHKLDNFFPLLQEIEVEASGLRKVYKENFVNFQQLRTVSLPDNEIEFLPGDLFARNHKIRHIDVSRNRIKSIGHELFETLYQLEFLKFDDNVCFEGFGYFETDLSLIRDEVIANCSALGAVASREKKIKQEKNETGMKQQHKPQTHPATTSSTTVRSLITTLRNTAPFDHINEIPVGRRSERKSSGESSFRVSEFIVIAAICASLLLTLNLSN